MAIFSRINFPFYEEKGQGGFNNFPKLTVIEYNNQSRCERLSQIDLFTVANCYRQYIFTYLLYNINSTRHVAAAIMLKVYTGFFKKIINTLFFNQTFVTQNEHPVTDASRTPRGCGFDVLKSQKG